ncbi:DUF1127 domain-containing protein [Cognatazoarcus halotolerans]|uniref:DUF1127 domain-containing protein n=1 Tax=Cognatazoarcus halotolerans TaxID=2686016 RepID=UPI001358EC54|nr:DUF1127 domain-containing protein [Cognatazoarcus halotolerans]MCB1900928.1 DUF1127 domain-containing protein [Rhodocyclaceae bacterium]MCP5310180.1 DUF1127 domain-containing protein [Zoogloeaceae bacterium]
MAQFIHSVHHPVPALRSLRPARLGSAIASMVRTWLARDRQRRELRELDDAILRDVGISRAQASFSADKPFWRP